MPVHIEWDRDMADWDWSGAGGLELPSEEFWSKFEELPDLGDNLETLFAEASVLTSGVWDNGLEVRNEDVLMLDHDCMWTGACRTENCEKHDRKRTTPAESSGAVGLFGRPDTPQSSDSEAEKQVFPASQITNQIRVTNYSSVSFDHDYDKKNTCRGKVLIRPEELGVLTPSDSEEEEAEENNMEDNSADENSMEEEESSDEEEEIDVVSVSSSPQRRNLSCNLPTNPTVKAYQLLQETVTDSLLTASRAVSRRLQQSGKRKTKNSPNYSTNPGRRRIAKKNRFSSTKTDSVAKRSMHNNMERMRRIELRNAFEELRQLVPSIADSHKAAKVTILRDATHYLQELSFRDRNYSLQVGALRGEQEKLRRTLSQLRRIFARNNKAK